MPRRAKKPKPRKRRPYKRRVDLTDPIQGDQAFTVKEALFIEYFMQNGFNASAAAKSAGYAGDRYGYYHVGRKVRRRPEVSGEIERRLADFEISKDDATRLLSLQARASLDPFIEIVPQLDKEGKQVIDPVTHQPAETWRFNIVAAKRAGFVHLLKSVRETDRGIALELVDSQGALDKLCRVLNLYKTPELPPVPEMATSKSDAVIAQVDKASAKKDSK